ncbi:nucleoside-diphosphate kinase [Mesorhizobium sp. WSM3860]|uniref:nucleoside-diphosphate kinase n=1 Tax=Mesorhizobium sp. WSM3860 TaxID=2029403 RepID=UPI000BAFE6AF|nr:nucleoside-diphosphate kinase [Mesorhizobium sp. WSM3860]PBC05935.1 nucleoside-diphosphate kinase [Mesorhizobium sp. WSM3860]
MTRTIYRLTTKDLAILEAMLIRRRGFADAIVPMLERKLAESSIVPVGMLEPDVATLNSRVVFRVDEGAPETRTLMLGDAFAPVGSGLPVGTWRGLCLLGMRAGQSVLAKRPDGSGERILLEDVAYQPDAARQATPTAGQRPRGPRLVYSATADRWPLGGAGKIRQTEGDDPGPSAA